MRYTVGIDLGSTTTKAVILDPDGDVLGRGITNSRSNYDVACSVALGEALINTRFSLIAGALGRAGMAPGRQAALVGEFERHFRAEQYRSQLRVLAEQLHRVVRRLLTRPAGTDAALDRILDRMRAEVDGLYTEGAERKSDFFRDLAGARYLALAEGEARDTGVGFDVLAGLFDKAILDVENSADAAGRFEAHAAAARASLRDADPRLAGAIDEAARVVLEQAGSVGTGYGRQRLPFPKGRSDRRSSATVSARTRCFRPRARCSTSAVRTPRPSRSTTTASSRRFR